MIGRTFHARGEGRNRRQVLFWLLQRVSGAALLFLACIHVWVMHWRTPGTAPVYSDVVRRLKTVGFIAVDFSLLGFGLFHALNGIRNILYDSVRSPKLLRAGILILVVVGLVLTAAGSIGLLKIIVPS